MPDRVPTSTDEATAAYDILEQAEEANEAAAGPNHESLSRALHAAGERVPDAVEWLIEHDLPAAIRCVAVLTRFWQDVGLVDLGRALTERAIEAVGPAGERSAPYAAALAAAAELAFRQGDQAAAEAHATRAAEIARQVGEPTVEAKAYTDLARVAFRAGDAARIEAFARRALDVPGAGPLARRGGLHMLAWAAHTAGDLDEAQRRFEASLAYRQELGDRFAIAVEIANLGDLALERGDLPSAARHHAAALSVARDLDNRYLIVNALPSFAALAARAGDSRAAAQLLGATDAVAEGAGLVPDPGATSDVEQQLDGPLTQREVVALRTAGARLPLVDAVGLALAVASRITDDGGRAAPPT